MNTVRRYAICFGVLFALFALAITAQTGFAQSTLEKLRCPAFLERGPFKAFCDDFDSGSADDWIPDGGI